MSIYQQYILKSTFDDFNPFLQFINTKYLGGQKLRLILVVHFFS